MLRPTQLVPEAMAVVTAAAVAAATTAAAAAAADDQPQSFALVELVKSQDPLLEHNITDDILLPEQKKERNGVGVDRLPVFDQPQIPIYFR